MIISIDNPTPTKTFDKIQDPFKIKKKKNPQLIRFRMSKS